MINLIGISGKIGSGKDTVGKIIQFLISPEYKNGWRAYENWIYAVDNNPINSKYKILKFADKLKDIVCLLIGCTREQLEDSTFKEAELGEEWWCYYCEKGSHEDYQEKLIPYPNKVASLEWIKNSYNGKIGLLKLTPRKLLQLLGTECGREIIHPNIWVNSLFADYVGGYNPKFEDREDKLDMPNWIITDVRFPNEVKSIKDRGGVVIRVNTQFKITDALGNTTFHKKEEIENILKEKNSEYILEEALPIKEHPSETALDNYTDWDYVIDNTGTIEDLIEKVKNLNLV